MRWHICKTLHRLRQKEELQASLRYIEDPALPSELKVLGCLFVCLLYYIDNLYLLGIYLKMVML